MSGSNKKKGDDKFLKILREMVTYEGNRYCFDCNQRGPTYVNITIGSFVCTSCGGALRKYSHRVKSISMSNFSQTEMDFMKKRGNDMCRKMYFGLCDRSFTDVKNDKLDDLLRQKYELKKWFIEPTREQEDEAEKQNQELFDRVEKPNHTRPGQRPMVNAAAGLIVQPPKHLAAISRTIPNTNSVATNGDLKINHSKVQPPTVSQPAAPPTKSNNLIDDFGSDPFGMSNNFTPNPVSEPQSSFDFLSSVSSGPPPPSIQPQSSQPINIYQSKPPPPPPQASSSIDKYAALAELDAELFASTGGPPSTGVYNSPPRGPAGTYGGYNSPPTMQAGVFPTAGISSSMSASAGWPVGSQPVAPGWPAMPPTAPVVSSGGWVNPFGAQTIQTSDSSSMLPNPFAAPQQQSVSMAHAHSGANPFTSWSQSTVNTSSSGLNGTISSSGWNQNLGAINSGFGQHSQQANPFAIPSNTNQTSSQLPSNGNSASRNPFL